MMSPRSKSKETAWISQVYDRLDFEWQSAGELFAEFERTIPLHRAMRHLARLGLDEDRGPNAGRWALFVNKLSLMAVEWESGPQTKCKATDRVRLQSWGACNTCGGPLRRSGWSRACRTTVCMNCAAASHPVAPAVSMSPISAADQIRVSQIASAPPGSPGQSERARESSPARRISERSDPIPGFVYRAKRAFADYLRLSRKLPFSQTKTLRFLDNARWLLAGINNFLSKLRRPPVGEPEYRFWMQNYRAQHPP